MTVKCSVVVPVWNPGPNLARCVESLLAQTMDASEFEIVLVDDGSTDGTAQRLDALARAHPGQVTVLRIPASGWPGRPRNVGIDAARGEYIHFVDNDDVLPPYALQAMYDAAIADGADVVIGRPASDFRGINHAIYRKDVRATTLAEFPDLAETTTPHKMFRRELLDAHDIRFPEGTPHEDQVFVMQAYIHATAITVLTDRCYYFYLRRLGSGRNAGDRPLAPTAQYDAVERVLDVIDKGVSDPDLRDRLARRFYRVELLNHLWSPGMRDATPEHQRRVFVQTRRVVESRFGPGVRQGAGVVHRTMGTLVDDGDLPGTLAFVEHCRRLGLRASVTGLSWRAAGLVVEVDAVLQHGSGPLRCEPAGTGWALPAALAPAVPAVERLLDPERDDPDAELMLMSRLDAVAVGLGPGLRIGVDPGGAVRVTGTAVIDPSTALMGAPLTDGVWDLRLRVWFGGISRTPTVRLAPSARDGVIPLIAATTGAGVRSVRPFVSGADQHLALDVGSWVGSLPASLAPSSELEAVGRHRLRLTVGATSTAPSGVRLLLLPSDGTPGGPVTCGGTLGGGRGAGWVRGSATATVMASVTASVPSPRARSVATVRLPFRLPRGSWRPWLLPAGPSAVAPVALPWLVHRSRFGLHAVRMPLRAREEAP